MSAVPKLADKKSLKNLVPLNGLSSAHFEELAKKATILELKPGKYLFKKGERDSSTCYILDGEIALVDGSDIKLTIEGGTEEAKHPIAPQQPRQLGARAKTRCTVISIDSGLLDVMLSWEQSASYEVDDIESDDEDWMTRMMQSDLLQRLPATNLQQLFMRMEEVETKASEVVVNQDDEGDYYYIIKQGTCIVSRKPSANAREVKLAELSDGDSFGEESLLSGAKRNASVTMLTDGKLMRLSKKDFNELLKSPLMSHVTYDQAKPLVQNGAVLLDVRLPGEYSNAHLDNSINIPLAAIRTEITSIDRDKEYIVYCDTGRRSTSAVFLLGQFGIDANVLKDGLSNVPIEEYTTGKEQSSASAEIIDINRDKADVADAGPIKAELDAIKNEKSLLEKSLSELTKEVKSLKQKIGQSEQQLVVKENDLEETKASIANEKGAVKDLEDELQGLRSVEIEYDKLKEQFAKIEQEAAEKEKLLENAQASDESLQKKLISQQEQIEKIKSELKKSTARVSDAEEVQEANISEIDSLNDTLNALKSEKNELTNKLDEISKEKENLGKDVDASVGALNAELESLRASMAVLQSEKISVDGELQAEHERIASLQEQVDAKEVEKQALSVKIAKLEGGLDSDREQLAGIQSEKSAMENELNTLRSQLDEGNASSHEKITAMESEIREYQQAKADMSESLKQSTNKVSELQGELDKARQENESTIEQTQSSQQDLETRLNETSIIRTQLESEVEGLNEKIHALEVNLEEIKQAGQQQAQADKEKIDSLQSALENTSEDKSAKEASLQAEIVEYQQKLQAKESDIQVSNEKILEHEGKLNVLKQSHDAQQQASNETIKSLQASLDDAIKNRTSIEKDLQQKVDDVTKLHNEANQKIETLEEKLRTQEADFNVSKESTEKLNQEYVEKIKSLDSELQSKQSIDVELKSVTEKLKTVELQHTEALEKNSEAQQQIESHVRKLEVLEKDRDSISAQHDQAKNRIDELTEINKQLEDGNQDEAIQMELQELRSSLADAEKKSQEKDGLIVDKASEEEELRKELAALRAVYVQKESDVERLQNDLSQAIGKISEFEKTGATDQQGKQAAEEELNLVRERYEQSEREYHDTIESLNAQVLKISELEKQSSDALSQKQDAESALKVMEDEVDKIRAKSEQHEKAMNDSVEQINSLNEELEKLRELQKDWRVTEGDLANNNELIISQEKVSELEKELRSAQLMLDNAQNQVQSHNNTVNDQDEIKSQIAQLKSEMDEQLGRYKSELDNESSQLKDENKGLRDELKALHKEHEAAIRSEREAVEKRESAVVSSQEAEEKDHSALFDLPDIEKNLFANKTGTVESKNNWLMVIVVALVFSLLTAAGVYWYFVMSKPVQTVRATELSSSNVEKTVAVKSNQQVSPAVKSFKKKTTQQKPLFSKNRAGANKKTVAPKAGNGNLKPTRVYSDFLQSGGSGPVMVGVPAGIFSMGSPDNSTHFDERPQHTVSVRKFSISKFEVSFADYDRFSRDSGRPRPSDNGWGRGKRPVINVTWDDAVAYTQWLSNQTGHEYRLPSEAEWEYAARAGTKGKYWWGNDYESGIANCFNCGSQWDRISSAPTGSFSASSLGLHDMTGNVMEWVMDCYYGNYGGAPIDGAVRADSGCDKRVVRGGSYHSTADNIRVTKRSEYTQDSALDQIGFRVVRVK